MSETEVMIYRVHKGLKYLSFLAGGTESGRAKGKRGREGKTQATKTEGNGSHGTGEEGKREETERGKGKREEVITTTTQLKTFSVSFEKSEKTTLKNERERVT